MLKGKKIMKIDFVSYVIRNDAGAIDHEATLNKFMGDLVEWENVNLSEDILIENALNSIFDENNNAKVVKPLLIGQVFAKISNRYEDYGRLSKRIADYLAGSNKFVASRGQNGGITRK
ncbi:hypothetical protein EBT16_06405 [bacterium]|nr:hypothetical protein [bacterium]